MRRVLVVAVTLLTLGSPPAALARAGELDRSFAGDGTLVLHPRGLYDTRLESLAVEPGAGALLLGEGGVVARVTPGGRVRSVARRPGGRDEIVWPAFAVPHADGGALLTGRVNDGDLGAFPLAPDLSPAAPPHLVNLDRSIPYDSFAAVPRSRGGALVAVTARQPPDVDAFTTRVFALRADGRLDPAFGTGGVAVDRAASFGLLAAADPGGGATLFLPGGAGRPQPQRLLRVSAAGRFRRPAPIEEYVRSPVAIVRQGARMLVATPEWFGALRDDGTRDPAFHGGRAIAVPSQEALGAIAVDRVGRILVASSLGRPGNAVVLRRYSRAGRLDRRFGNRGRVRFHFGPVISDADFGRRAVPQAPEALALDHYGRILVGASVGNGFSDIREDFGSNYLAVARLRTTEPDADISSRRLRMTRDRIVRIPIRCRDRGRRCSGRVSLVVGGRVARGAYSLAPGSSASVHVRAARRGSRATVRIRAAGRPGDAVDRLVRLVRTR